MSNKRKPVLQNPSAQTFRSTSSIAGIKIVALCCLGLLIIMLGITKIAGDDDVFWHLATGRWIIEHNSIPSEDVFGHPFPHQEWIPIAWAWDAFTYFLYSTTHSYVALQLLPALVWLCIFSLLAIMMMRKNVSLPIMLITLLLALLTSLGRMRPRPLIISLLGVVLIWFIYTSFRDNKSSLKFLYAFPFIFLVWSNMHMGVLMGFAMFFVIILTEHTYCFLYKRSSSQKSYPFSALDTSTLKKLWLILFVCIAAAFINPYGYYTFLYVYGHTNMNMLQLIQEWQPPFSSVISESGVLWGYKAMLLLGILCVFYSFRSRTPYPLVLYVLFSVYSLRAIRFIADFAIMTALGTSLGLQFLVDRSPAAFRKALQGTMATLLLIAFMVVTVMNIPNENFYRDRLNYYNHFGFGIDQNMFSLPMIEFLNNNQISGKIFNQMEIGGLLLWERPNEKNFNDSRILNDSITKEYDSILRMRQGFEQKLEQYGIDYIVLHPLDLLESPAVMQMSLISYCSTHRETWKLVYWDDHSMIYIKDVQKFKPVIDKYEYRVLHPYLVALDKNNLDSLYAALPTAFNNELQRKLTEEPKGFFTNMCLVAARHYKTMN